MSKQARRIKQLEEQFRGDAALYELSEPMTWEDWGEDKQEQHQTYYVAVSAVALDIGGPETYIFPTDDQGYVLNWIEMEGSYKGGLDHNMALENTGYEIVERFSE